MVCDGVKCAASCAEFACRTRMLGAHFDFTNDGICLYERLEINYYDKHIRSGGRVNEPDGMINVMLGVSQRINFKIPHIRVHILIRVLYSFRGGCVVLIFSSVFFKR